LRRWGGKGEGGVGGREGVGQVGEMTQALYAHMNNKRKKKQIGILLKPGDSYLCFQKSSGRKKYWNSEVL
jgi:hypothetical protein